MISRRIIFTSILTCLVSLAAGMLVVAPAEAQSRPLAVARTNQADKAAADALTGQLTDKALAAFHAGKYPETLALLDQRASVTPEDQGMGLIRAWSLYHLNRYDQALSLFTQLDRRESTKDTQYGLYYSNRRLDPAAIGD
jgi:tetratricopeptide (TPR) repeat protein